MSKNIKELNSIQKGSIIRLSDFHTLEECNDSATVTVTEVHQWSIENINVFGFNLEVSEEVTLMLMIRCIGNEISDCRLFREIDSCLQGDCAFGLIVDGPTEWDADLEEDIPSSTFGTFAVVHSGEEDFGALEYVVVSPFPFWGVKKNDGETVALCEYLAYGTEENPIEENYWAKYGFVEWYADVGEDGEEGLRTLWFGWDVNEDDFDII